MRTRSVACTEITSRLRRRRGPELAATLCAASVVLAATGEGVLAHEGYGSEHGHLEGSSANLDVVSELRLTDVQNSIADVATFGDYAYLSTTGGACKAGSGIHVVNISDPQKPTRAGYLASESGSYAADGLHVIRFQGRDVLVHSNLNCDSRVPAQSGFSVWDVTDPVAARKLSQSGDSEPRSQLGNQFHMVHSVQAFAWNDRLYAVTATDFFEREPKDVDIYDITPSLAGGGPVRVSETGIDDWPAALDGLGEAQRMFHHDMQHKVINGHSYLLLSYWDAGQVLLNIDDPAKPEYVADSDYPALDPQLGQFRPEGESHSSAWSADNTFVLSTEEDFTSARTRLEIKDGTHSGTFPAREMYYTPPVPEGGFSGQPVFGGTGCASDRNGNGVRDDAEVPPAPAVGDGLVVFTQGGCHQNEKIATARFLQYDAMIMAGTHENARGGLTADEFGFCPNDGFSFSPVAFVDDALLPSACIGHQTLHRVFDEVDNGEDTSYPRAPFGNEADLPAIGSRGSTITLHRRAFDGWGYVRLHDAQTLQEIDSYAIPEAVQPQHATGSGTLTAHDVKTDPRLHKDLAYITWFGGGLRVVRFGEGRLDEVGHHIDGGGSDYWGISVICVSDCAHPSKNRNARPLLAVSDRDFGLKILRYTGPE